MIDRSWIKQKRFKIIKVFLQIISFILIPGLFADTFHSCINIIKQLIPGNIQWESIRVSLWILFATIPAVFFFGRQFCAFFCSFGAMQDLIWQIARQVRKRLHLEKGTENHRSKGVSVILRYVKYIILIFCVVINIGGFIELTQYSPWSVFGQLTSLAGWKQLKSMSLIGMVMLLAIVLASVVSNRCFCRYICPMGAIYGWIAGKGRIKKKLPPEIGLLVLIVTIVIAKVMISFGSEKEVTQYEISQQGEGRYEDGVYEGSSKGYRGKTVVQVTVSDGYIQNIEIVSSDDDQEYLQIGKGVIRSIIENQHTNVDAMSGATLSSHGIIRAVRDAIPGSVQTEKSADKNQEADSSEETYEDGVYRGVAEAFRGDVEVEVTVKKSRISDVKVVSYYDDDEYFDQAMEFVIPQMIEKKSLHVDAISGATYSSNGIIKAAANALGVSEDTLQLKQGEKLSSMHNKHGHRVKKYK